MKQNPVYIGKNKGEFKQKTVQGALVFIDGEHYNKIENCDKMRPFFMSIISDSNHWMFISSNGGLTAGRKDSDHALFPYYTDDKITESADLTGSKTIFHVHEDDKTYLWEPFSNSYAGCYEIQRNIYKNTYGNKIIFEEINHDLKLSFQYQWNSSNLYGFIKKSQVLNLSDEQVTFTVLDGIQNIMPHGVASDFQNSKSNLADAYKKNELELPAGLGIYSLSAIIVDKAEPSEALKANTVWSSGLPHPKHLICSKQLQSFRSGNEIETETDIRAEKGAYFLNDTLTLNRDQKTSWLFVANVNQGPSEIVNLIKKLSDPGHLVAAVLKDIEQGSENLKKLASETDGLQFTNDILSNTRHYANVVFNCMRGGVFDNNYTIETADFLATVKNANTEVYDTFHKTFETLPEQISSSELKTLSDTIKNPDFKRLASEYMPLRFSRRHGDPSRPWNKFSINTHNETDGSKILDYEGNWRDIFQNWEALGLSYPEFFENMIARFLNASTFEGYNAYRITKTGFDWEVSEPNDPWSFIGYWGDHQIIYLLKFLEHSEKYFPGKLAANFNEATYVYANVPYKIKSYTDIVKNPKDTITFDHDEHNSIDLRKSKIGADGALLRTKTDEIHHVSFVEKILATLLSKCSNLIPEAGIWMNTQRPEWNDANNALVGNGTSMVTLYYLRRFAHFIKNLIANYPENFEVSGELNQFFSDLKNILEQNQEKLNSGFTNRTRKEVTDQLGIAGSNYRNTIYKNSFSGSVSELSKSDLSSFLDTVLAYFDHSIQANERADTLYHAYNLIDFDTEGEFGILHLPKMLEGQVAVLSSGLLPASSTITLLDQLFKSDLYRDDQHSFMLYPDKQLPRFVDKNNISQESIAQSALIKKLIDEHNFSIVEKDNTDQFHFNGNFNNAQSLKNALTELPDEYDSLVKKDRELILDLFESTFTHRYFTGRSGTFYGYEGLGSIYWHMNSKLLLAVQECFENAIEENSDAKDIQKLYDHFKNIKEGIGVHKAPEVYGAFTTDPYSHTPGGKGIQQPGMTGQVKEDILSRFGELGLQIKKGDIHFSPSLLSRNDFLMEDTACSYMNSTGDEKELALKKGSLAFLYCQTPIIYQISDSDTVTVLWSAGRTTTRKGQALNADESQHIFSRNGSIDTILVTFNSSKLPS